MIVHMLLEGQHEEPLAKALIRHCGHEPGVVYGGRGCEYIRQKAKCFVYLAQAGNGLLILTDFMDSRCACPPEAFRQYVSVHCQLVPPSFLCRFAVNELESWLLADRDGIADFLRISVAKVPTNPEMESDPKRALVDLARISKNSQIRSALVPSPRHRGIVGPGYTMTITEFINKKWSPARAEPNSQSLARCMKRLRELDS